jgi:hypothetical protein
VIRFQNPTDGLSIDGKADCRAFHPNAGERLSSIGDPPAHLVDRTFANVIIAAILPS